MSVPKTQQMSLDTERAAHTRMEDQPKGSYRFQLLQAWCGLLTLALVVMAVHLATTNQKPAETRVAAPESINTTRPTQRQIQEPPKPGMSHSFIQLYQYPDWKESEPRCKSCPLVLQGKSICVKKEGFYFVYAQVTFRKEPSVEKRVFLQTTGSLDNNTKLLAEGIYPNSAESSVWVAKIVKLRKSDRVSINITAEIRKDQTYWGLIELH